METPAPTPTSPRYMLFFPWAFRHPFAFSIINAAYQGTFGAGAVRYFLLRSSGVSAIAGVAFAIYGFVVIRVTIARYTPERDARSRARYESMPAWLNMLRWPSWILLLFFAVTFTFLVDAGYAAVHGNALKAVWFIEFWSFFPLFGLLVYRWRRRWETEHRRPIAGTRETSLGEIAGLGRRLLARLIDWTILLFVTSPLVHPLERYGQNTAGVAAIVGFIVLGLAYEIAMTTWRGGTAGKLAMGLRITSEDKQTLSAREAARRCGWATLFLVVPILNIIAIAFGFRKPNHQTLYDRRARTLVLRVATTSHASLGLSR